MSKLQHLKYFLLNCSSKDLKSLGYEVNSGVSMFIRCKDENLSKNFENILDIFNYMCPSVKANIKIVEFAQHITEKYNIIVPTGIEADHYLNTCLKFMMKDTEYIDVSSGYNVSQLLKFLIKHWDKLHNNSFAFRFYTVLFRNTDITGEPFEIDELNKLINECYLEEKVDLYIKNLNQQYVLEEKLHELKNFMV